MNTLIEVHEEETELCPAMFQWQSALIRLTLDSKKDTRQKPGLSCSQIRLFSVKYVSLDPTPHGGRSPESPASEDISLFSTPLSSFLHLRPAIVQPV